MTLISRVDDDDLAARVLNRTLIDYPRGSLAPIVADRTILITGAGGYIGSAIAHLVAELAPRRVVLVDNSELALYEVDRALRFANPDLAIVLAFCDIRDSTGLERLFAREHPDIVIHTAALKHLPVLEVHPRDAVLTNVLGTANLAACCLSHGVRAMVHISTDKAADPVSVLGASKRAAEAILQAADAAGPTRCSSVRFSNVFGSTGSVVPLFLDQIAKHRKITITHPGMHRAFLTANEAVQLVLQVLSLSLEPNAPAAPVFVLEAGLPLSITDLAHRLLDASGAAPWAERIETIGMRRGEKLEESLSAPWEDRVATRYQFISRAVAEPLDRAAVAQLADRARAACDRFDEAAIVELLWQLGASPDAEAGMVPGMRAFA